MNFEPMMPNGPFMMYPNMINNDMNYVNNIFNKFNEFENRIKKIEQRISKLENESNINNDYSEPSNSLYML